MTRFLFCLLMLAARTICSQSDNSLVAKFTFNNGNARNEVSGEYAKAPATLYTEDRFGNARSAVYMHGSPGSYLNLGTGDNLKSREATIALWIKIDMPMYGGTGFKFNPVIVTKNGPGSDFCEAYSVVYDYNTRRLMAAASHSEYRQVQLGSQDTFPLRQWHHVAITYDDAALDFYIDGKLQSSVAKNYRSIYLKGDSIVVGNTASVKNNRSLCGSADDIMIYNRVLLPEEIEALYTAPDPNKLNNYLKWAYRIIGLVVIVALVTWAITIQRYKRKLKREAEQNRVNALLSKFETRAIRAQMNPHFIFNSLNTLQRFILEEDIPNAHTYLTRFSELLRKLLESSSAEVISLKEEIEILRHYIEIEELRFSDAFDFRIRVEIDDPETIFIPFMLIQPLVENAIWHGLLPKTANRVLTLSFFNLDEKRVRCTVEDNGVGRAYHAGRNQPFRKKSMALEFIRQRLDIIEKTSGVAGHITIKDKHNNQNEAEGTLVELIIPKLI